MFMSRTYPQLCLIISQHHRDCPNRLSMPVRDVMERSYHRRRLQQSREVAFTFLKYHLPLFQPLANPWIARRSSVIKHCQWRARGVYLSLLAASSASFAGQWCISMVKKLVWSLTKNMPSPYGHSSIIPLSVSIGVLYSHAEPPQISVIVDGAEPSRRCFYFEEGFVFHWRNEYLINVPPL